MEGRCLLRTDVDLVPTQSKVWEVEVEVETFDWVGTRFTSKVMCSQVVRRVRPRHGRRPVVWVGLRVRGTHGVRSGRVTGAHLR